MHVFTRFAPWGSIPRSLAIRYAAWKTKASGCEFAIACAFVVAALAFSLTMFMFGFGLVVTNTCNSKKNKKDGVAATSSHFSSCCRLDGLTDHPEGFVVGE